MKKENLGAIGAGLFVVLAALFLAHGQDYIINRPPDNYGTPTAPIGSGEIQTSAVTTAKIAADAVTTTKIINAAVDTNKLATDSVTNAKLLNDAASLGKVSNQKMFADSDGIGIGTTNPSTHLHVVSGNTDTGKLQVGDATHASCLMLGDKDNAGCTECTVLNGVMTCTTDADCICDGS